MSRKPDPEPVTEATPEPTPAPPAPKPGPKRLRVSIREGSRLTIFVDPQTHIEVTREPREVPAAMVGDATRREPVVVIEEV